MLTFKGGCRLQREGGMWCLATVLSAGEECEDISGCCPITYEWLLVHVALFSALHFHWVGEQRP